MALSFIGKPISLISHSDVRYRGILAGIDPAASTIQLSNVFSMGTESRRPMNEYIPPVQEPYQYIIFRASEVKDLSVDEPPSTHRNIHDDPAVLGASQGPPVAPAAAPAAAPTYAQQTAGRQGQQGAQTQQQQQQQGRAPPPRQNNTQNQTTPAISSAAASLETVERALGDLRVSNNNNNNGRRQRNRRNDGGGGPATVTSGGVTVPAADFDFASMNAKFDKAALAARSNNVRSDGAGSDRTNPSDDDEKESNKGAYNPQKSFFDSLSAAPVPQRGHGGGSGGRGRGRGRGGFNRREEERERNVATFGEPGGVGLLGPGGYVGGWGGHGGRRGGGRRRGPGRSQQQQQQQA
ncbi:LSM14 domain-containing protein [Mycena chlorophos]|uniref:LSM14 domain-containing protein n=1 Tax=Mycena chlorophos TaxID=658473 RepID=A0A8H6T742_MYCCL|nr:LSM14 domain-containing protein [Mycena chlorophos]